MSKPIRNAGVCVCKVPVVRISSMWMPHPNKPIAGRLINPEGLPALVGLVRDGADDGVSQLAAVLGPLEPPKRLYGNEQTME